MFKKENLEDFLFLYNNIGDVPFTHFEDALVNNFDALDVPFPDYCKSVEGWCDFLQIEISENYLSLPIDDKFFYLNYLKNKIKLETGELKKKTLVELLNFYDVNSDILDYEKNKPLKDLLNLSFKSITGLENLKKFRDLHREYYQYLLNIERNGILNHVNGLIEVLENRSKAPNKRYYKNSNWFKVGVLFASGEMEKYCIIPDKGKILFKVEFNPPKIAKDLENLSFEKNILGTISEYSSKDKNIFYSKENMLKIISHCNENGISVKPYFTNRLPSE
ncbi:MAG: hypothetical protein V7734_07675 [Maribacter arcticus]|uniref:hypothetical protein n=1 Tax=Maribacter arcticus TaxID=561365 RepID=UPI00300213DD